MQNILVPVDFSEYSENALKTAAAIARKKDSQLYVLHVIEIAEPVLGTGAMQVNDNEILFFSKLAKKKLQEFLQKDYLQGINITNIIRLGPTYHSVTRNIDEFDIDLIVMGSKGSSGLREFFIGSNTEKVVRYSSVPVLVIKNELNQASFKKIVFVSDFDKENISSFKKAQNFASAFDSELKLMAINTKGDGFENVQKIRNEIQEFIEAAGTAYSPEDAIVYQDKRVEEGILNGANSIEADLIAIPTHGRSGLSHFFNGSIAEDVLNHSMVPVITFRIGE